VTPKARWTDEAWRAQALSWAADRLAERGLTVTGAAEQPHVMAWATALRIPTTGGPYWLKANGPGTAYEAVLVGELARWVPDDIVLPVAVDAGRGWLLSPDAGPTVRSQRPEDAHEPAMWAQALREFAELQRTVAPHASELLAAGVPDQRPDVMPGKFGALLAARDEVRPGLDEDTLARLDALRPEYAAWCAELDGFGIPASIQHDDLHDANLLAGTGRYRFFDWGDACVSHPFGVLLVSLRVAGYRGVTDLAPVRDAYLEPWTADYARADLVRAAQLAVRVAKVGRALSYQRALCSIAPADRGEDGRSIGGWLGELLEPDVPPAEVCGG
jgi:hypothetical protein